MIHNFMYFMCMKTDSRLNIYKYCIFFVGEIIFFLANVRNILIDVHAKMSLKFITVFLTFCYRFKLYVCDVYDIFK